MSARGAPGAGAASAAAPRQRSGERVAYTPQSLLAVAVEAFNQRGYDGTSMEDLAHATGITKSSIYHHVRSKEELLRLAVSRALDRLFAMLEQPEACTGRSIDRLEHMVRSSVQVLVDELPYVTLLLRVRGNTDAEQWALQRRREFDRRVSEMVRSAVEDGDLRDDVDPRLTTRLLFGMINSVVEWYEPSGTGSATELADAVMRLAFDGLRRRDPAT
ncbi:MAG TPA: TetR/AcrR family transcriptional regulator [Candidatus Dormibacteraeota bacterium]|jgi:AcrR family transcriptional regulator